MQASDFLITDHARMQMRRRNITETMVLEVLAAPDERFQIREGRELFQSVRKMEEKEYMIRIFVDVDRNPAEIVTVYRTTKIGKYRRITR